MTETTIVSTSGMKQEHNGALYMLAIYSDGSHRQVKLDGIIPEGIITAVRFQDNGTRGHVWKSINEGKFVADNCESERCSICNPLGYKQYLPIQE